MLSEDTQGTVAVQGFVLAVQHDFLKKRASLNFCVRGDFAGLDGVLDHVRAGRVDPAGQALVAQRSHDRRVRDVCV